MPQARGSASADIADVLAQRRGVGGGELAQRVDDEVLLDGGEHRFENAGLDQPRGLSVGDHGPTAK
jgi:hypothetical protein